VDAIPAEEFRTRQLRAREAAQAAGLDAVVVYSRGGGFMDMSADVLWETLIEILPAIAIQRALQTETYQRSPAVTSGRLA
jgi:hypothetical protein